ncbi:VTT domain-containing protein [Cytobacillus sp. S13-E01]|uniref:TVP38/TMEM64 family protein n=1 Tax=Cytobacillus sp. S13-E01 TaxID=3031326 RepID=UPI0023D80903|nr:VTT domain-containing protein [Cytobacillus sp. S13-E01]MDF0727480.1 VTT domain-containing protein [Cytobacillus sp. S13-E01]
MDETLTMLFVFVGATGFLAPIVFICLHVLRPFFFIPVPVMCIVGGILFGSVFGTLYSLIGLTALSIVFYIMYKKMPTTFKKLILLKEKWLGNKVNFTIGQIAILRLIPFINFHLLSLCIIETTRNFREYVKGSIFTNVSVALFYTVFGQFIREFSTSIIIMILLALTLLFYLLREKQVIIKWDVFFKTKTEKSFL